MLILKCIPPTTVNFLITVGSLQTIFLPQAYFLSAFRNALFKKLQEKKKLYLQAEPEPEFAIDTFIIQEENDAEIRVKLQNALFQLTSKQREAIYLRFYEGLSYEEVAVILGITVKATYKIMARALLGLKEHLQLVPSVLLLLLRNYC